MAMAKPASAGAPLEERAVFAWGLGEDGQLGVPPPAPQAGEEGGGGAAGGGAGASPYRRPMKEWFLARPTRVAVADAPEHGREGSAPVAALLAGSRYSGVVTRKGSLYTWGWNQKCALGLGHNVEVVSAPSPVRALEGRRVMGAAFGGWHAVALDSDGQVSVWGGNEYRQGTDTGSTTLPSPVPGPSAGLHVRQVSAGGMHTLVCTEVGEVWGWGQPLVNHLGAHSRPSKVPGLHGVAQISAGAFHNLALTQAGDVFAWGNADFGQLGLGTTTHVGEPQEVSSLHGRGVCVVSAGGWHSMAATEEGDVWVWGRGELGRLGLPDQRDHLVPAQLPLPEHTKVADVKAGGTHSLLLTDDGVCLSFGRCSYGRLGREVPEGTAYDEVPRPVELPTPEGEYRWRVLAIAAGGRHSLLLATLDQSDTGTPTTPASQGSL